MAWFSARNVAIAALATVAVGAGLREWPEALSALHLSHNRVNFATDIRPIFNQNCTSCHGGVRQKNNVSFIFRDEALGTGKSGHPTIVPGNPDASELMTRVTSNDPDARMPYHTAPLPPEQIALLRQWIKEGAQWEDHWSFVPPKEQALPEVKQANWVRQPMDRFILARLEKESLAPSGEASKTALLRRVSLDITGLPPTAEEEAAYVADTSANAYEKQVDRLLASPSYGERWASMWLDLARYADTKGYEADRDRPGMWPYRDWVIDGFNKNVPYDKFVVTQLAGDLLPNATFEDEIATSFHRQTPNNSEGGTDSEEYRMIAVMDRVATTWSVLNGVTMNCVQCHSHPYDPIKHTDYYKSLAFFNSSNDADLDDDSPNLQVPKDHAQYAEAGQIQRELGSLLHSLTTSDRAVADKAQWKAVPIQAADANEADALGPVILDLQRRIAEVQKKKPLTKNNLDDIKDLRESIRTDQAKLAHARATNATAKTFRIQDGEAFAGPDTPSKSFYELTTTPDVPLVTAIRIEVPPIDANKARHTPEEGFIADKLEAFLSPANGHKTKITFLNFVQDSEINLETAIEQASAPKQKQLSGTDTPSYFAAERKLFHTRWIVGIPSEPLQIASGSQLEVRLKQTGLLDSKPALIQRVRISVSGDPAWTALGQDAKRTANLQRMIQLEEQLQKIPTVPLPVMSEELPSDRRATLEFERGNFLTKVGPDLTPDVPEIFPKLPDGAPRNRLTFAKWFFMPGQPLTARVAVNRYWEELFGTGIVETLENFGSVGEGPSHPELLDWLALHFQNDLHWDMKALLREMVTSATYRQSAVTSPSLNEKDPRNRLLARGPQQRLTAEMVRDQALVASGLLSTKMGGPPVMPPQPAGVWNTVYNDSKWTDATGPDRYRRAIYTFVKRTSGYPSFLMFDASDRDTSLPRRLPTNTPLQALVTLNDPVYQEAAEALAKRVAKEAPLQGSSDSENLDARLTYEARLVLSRQPTPRELASLRAFFQKTMANSSQPALINASMKVTKSASDKEISPQELDALTAVGSVLFNLDAALTR